MTRDDERSRGDAGWRMADLAREPLSRPSAAEQSSPVTDEPPENIVVIGSGGHGREIAEVCLAVARAEPGRVHLVGVIDDGPRAGDLARLISAGIAYLGTVAAWPWSSYACSFVVGVSDPTARRRIANSLVAHSRPATLVHPDATLGSQVALGPGCVVFAGARLSTTVRLGAHVHLYHNVTVGSDAVVDDFTTVCSAATVGSGTHTGAGVMVGAGAVVLDQRRVGDGSTVAAAACVVGDVPPDTVVTGVPATARSPKHSLRATS
ncbi:acetyltransferase [soil metagenome]